MDNRVGAVLVQMTRERRPVERLQLRVEAATGGELSTQEGVLKQHRGQKSALHCQKLRAPVLNLPFQFHPPVLEPRFHLWDPKQPISTALQLSDAQMQRTNRFTSNLSGKVHDIVLKMSSTVPLRRPWKSVHVTYLSFRKVQLLRNFPPLCSTQVFLLAESILQFANLLWRKLGPQPPLLGRFPFAVISHFALRPRRVVTTV